MADISNLFSRGELAMGASEVGKIHRQYTSPYTKKQFEDYQHRLAATLISEAMSGEQVGNDPNAKQFIEKFVKDNVLESKPKDLILGYTYHAAIMEVKAFEKSSLRESINYPILNKYKGHDLIETIFFKKTEDGSYGIGIVEVKPSTN